MEPEHAEAGIHREPDTPYARRGSKGEEQVPTRFINTVSSERLFHRGCKANSVKLRYPSTPDHSDSQY